MIQQSIKITVDAVIFGYDAAEGIGVLLIQRKNEPFKGKWALPGGFVEDDESLETAALRELEEETSLKLTTLDQVYTFGAPRRDPRGRTVSVAYVGLMRREAQLIKAASDAEKVRWFNISKLPNMAFDHRDVFTVALNKLKTTALSEPIGLELLDNYFPFSKLTQLYEAILGRSLNKNQFRKFMLKYGILKEATSDKARLSMRSQKVYQFDKKIYSKLKKNVAMLSDFLPF